MVGILLRLLIAALTFLLNIVIVKVVTLAVRHVPAVIKSEQKQPQQSRLRYGPSIQPTGLQTGGENGFYSEIIDDRSNGNGFILRIERSGEVGEATAPKPADRPVRSSTARLSQSS